MTTTDDHRSTLVLNGERSAASLPNADSAAPLPAHVLDRIDRYWRAANYLSVGLLSRYDNPC